MKKLTLYLMPLLILLLVSSCSNFRAEKEIVTVENAKEIYSKNVNIRIDLQNAQLDIKKISKVSKEHPGKCGLMFHMASGNGRSQRIFAHNIKVSSNKSFLKNVRDIYGKENVWVSE